MDSASSSSAKTSDQQKRIKQLVSKLNSTLKEKSILSEEVVLLRERLRDECESLISDDSWRKQVVDTLWINCFYGPIKYYRSKAATMHADEKNWLQAFISLAVGHLTVLAEEYADVQFAIYIYLGDLRRYTFEMFKSEMDKRLSYLYYKNAFYLTVNSQVPNQIALLEQDNPMSAIKHHLRSLLMDNPYTKAHHNLDMLLKSAKSNNELCQTAMDFIRFLTCQYNRSDVIYQKNKFEKSLNDQWNKLSPEELLNVTYSVSLASIYSLKTNNDDDGFRNIVMTMLSTWQLFLKHFQEKANIKETEILNKRRRKRRSSSGSEEPDDDDDDDNGVTSDNEQKAIKHSNMDDAQADEIPDELGPTLVVILEWMVHTVDKMDSKRISVAIRMQQRALMTTLVEQLNRCLSSFQSFLGDEKLDENSAAYLEWLLNAPLLDKRNELQAQCLAIYITKVIADDRIPVFFDRFFKYVSNETELQLMKNMAKLHLHHSNKVSDKKAKSLPVYLLVGEADVLKHRSIMIRNFIYNTKMKVVVPRSVIHELDKAKKDTQSAREAVRAIETYLSHGKIYIVEKILPSPMDYAKHMLAEKNAQSVGTLVTTILTMGPTEKSEIAEISIENIHDFNSRTKKQK